MKTSRKTFSLFWSYTRRYPWQLGICLAMLPIASLSLVVLTPYLFSEIIAELIAFSGDGTSTRDSLITLLWLVVAAKIIELVSWRTISYIMPRLQANTMRDIERAIHDWLLQLSYSFHTNSFGGALISKGKRFVNEYERLFDLIYFEILPLFIRIIAITIILATISPLLSAVFAAWIVLYVGIVALMMYYKVPYSRESARSESAVTASFADAITNVLTIKAFGQEKYESERFSHVSEERHKKRWKSWLLDAHIRTVQNVIANAFELTILILATFMVLDNKISVADVVLLQLYLLPLLFALWQLGRHFQNFERSLSEAAEMTELLLLTPEIQDTNQAELQLEKGEIRFSNVDFEYSDSGNTQVLENFDLTVKPEQKLGLIGPSGGGKTTLTKLLLRFSDVTSGDISIDGQSIKEITQATLRQSIAYVAQEPILFHRTLSENIRYAKPDATQAEIEEAAKQANAHRFITKLEKGYETTVGERGTKLSGGEKQRVAIARAILKDAPLLVLDEATSALDSESETLIQKALTRLMQNRTTIVIAHRLSTIQNMDRIIVLKEGKIIEDGGHAELLAANKLYAKLWNHQSGGFVK